MQSINDIRKYFTEQFGVLAEKFEIYEFDVAETKTSNEIYVSNPGVYVYWNPKHGVVRVGVSMKNSRKRALTHLDKNTGGIMRALGDDSSTKILLFNIREKNDSHWVIALGACPTIRAYKNLGR